MNCIGGKYSNFCYIENFMSFCGSLTIGLISVQFSSVQSLSHVWLFETPWTAALSITNSWSLLKLMSIESVMPSNHLILCCPLLFLVFPSIRVFPNESVLRIRWPEYWSYSFSISPFHEYSGLICTYTDRNLWWWHLSDVCDAHDGAIQSSFFWFRNKEQSSG